MEIAWRQQKKKRNRRIEFTFLKFRNGNRELRRMNWFQKETALNPSSGSGLRIARRMWNKKKTYVCLYAKKPCKITPTRGSTAKDLLRTGFDVPPTTK